MAQQKDTKVIFIRKGGRIIPIRASKKSKKRRAAEIGGGAAVVYGAGKVGTNVMLRSLSSKITKTSNIKDKEGFIRIFNRQVEAFKKINPQQAETLRKVGQRIVDQDYWGKKARRAKWKTRDELFTAAKKEGRILGEPFRDTIRMGKGKSGTFAMKKRFLGEKTLNKIRFKSRQVSGSVGGAIGRLGRKIGRRKVGLGTLGFLGGVQFAGYGYIGSGILAPYKKEKLGTLDKGQKAEKKKLETEMSNIQGQKGFFKRMRLGKQYDERLISNAKSRLKELR